jgi:hypothetical protein
MSDNNTEPVIIWWWLKQHKRRGQEKRKHQVHLFIHDNLNSGAYFLKELNQNPELFTSFYQMSTKSFSLLVDLVEPQARKKYTNFCTVV